MRIAEADAGNDLLSPAYQSVSVASSSPSSAATAPLPTTHASAASAHALSSSPTLTSTASQFIARDWMLIKGTFIHSLSLTELQILQGGIMGVYQGTIMFLCKGTVCEWCVIGLLSRLRHKLRFRITAIFCVLFISRTIRLMLQPVNDDDSYSSVHLRMRVSKQAYSFTHILLRTPPHMHMHPRACTPSMHLQNQKLLPP